MNIALVIAVLIDSGVTLFVGFKLRGWARESIEAAATEMSAEISEKVTTASHAIVGEFVQTMGLTLKTTVAPLLAQLISKHLDVSATGRIDVRPQDEQGETMGTPLRAVTEQ